MVARARPFHRPAGAAPANGAFMKGIAMTGDQHQTLSPADAPVIVITREFDAPRELVWQAWTEPDHLAAWFAPEGFTVPRVELDFRPGGVMELDMEGPDGTTYPNKGTYLEIVPLERIVVSDQVQESDAWGDTPPPDNVQTLTFEALPDGRTRVTNEIRLNSIAARDAMLDMGAAKGWRQTLDKLDTHLASLQGR